MKRKSLKITTKVWMLNFSIMAISIISAFILSWYLYDRLYVDYVKYSIIDQTKELATQYEEGLSIEELQRRIAWLTTVVRTEAVVVDDLDRLSSILPSDKDNKKLISDADEEKVANMKLITKTFFDEKFECEFITVIHPLSRDGQVDGFVLAYNKLDSYNGLAKEFLVVWAMISLIIILFTSLFVIKLTNSFVKPLKEMELAANRVSAGDYSTTIHNEFSDEIGSFVTAFNKMSASLKEEDDMRREFLSDVTHEIRTPLSYIKGYTQVLLDNIVKDPENERNYLKLIDREATRMEILVKNLLDLNKLEANSFNLKLHPIVFSQCIEDVIMKYQSILQQKKLHVSLNLDPEVIISSDEKRLKQIIHHIIENAIRYSLDGGDIDISLYKRRKYSVLEIVDNGIGMSQQDLWKVKEKFYRVNKARTRNDGGTGIGLALVDKLMVLHGGKLSIESELDVGTKVCLIFPLLQDE